MRWSQRAINLRPSPGRPLHRGRRWGCNGRSAGEGDSFIWWIAANPVSPSIGTFFMKRWTWEARHRGAMRDAAWAQTVGEIRTRTNRLYDFTSLERRNHSEFSDVRPAASHCPSSPGRTKESDAHLLSGSVAHNETERSSGAGPGKPKDVEDLRDNSINFENSSNNRPSYFKKSSNSDSSSSFTFIVPPASCIGLIPKLDCLKLYFPSA